MLIISEEPQFPAIPSIGDVLTRKNNLEEFKYSILKCLKCGKKKERPFIEGDYVFKETTDDQCECNSNSFQITEVYAEFKKSGKKNK